MSIDPFLAFVVGMAFVVTLLGGYGIYLKHKSDEYTRRIDAYYDAEEAKKNVGA